MGTKLVLNRNYTLNSTLGHSIAFRKDVPTHVPPIMYAAAIAIGAVPEDGSDPNVLVDAPPVNGAPIDPTERGLAIRKAVDNVVARNERLDFTAAGVPTVGAVGDRLGWKPSAREIAQEWASRGERAMAASDAA